MDEKKVAHFRLPKSLLREIDHLAVDWETTRQGAIQALLELAMTAHRRGDAMKGST